MRKYLLVLKTSIQEIFIYRVNFVLWRVRTLLQLLVIYFLWSVIFSNQKELFGYTQSAILTYVLLTSILRSLVLSSRSVDVAGEIHQGTLTNFLLKPFSYISYWLTRDVADKLVNILFSALEISILITVLKPPLFIQSNIIYLSLFLVTSILAMFLWFYLSFLLSTLTFWIRDTWGPRFLTLVILEFLSGGVFPLDILPAQFFKILSLLPFPYLIFFPAKIYLGQLQAVEVVTTISILIFWILVSFFALKVVWLKGLRSYAAEGR